MTTIIIILLTIYAVRSFRKIGRLKRDIHVLTFRNNANKYRANGLQKIVDRQRSEAEIRAFGQKALHDFLDDKILDSEVLK